MENSKFESFDIDDIIFKLSTTPDHLSLDETSFLFEEIIEGQMPDVKIGAVLALLNQKTSLDKELLCLSKLLLDKLPKFKTPKGVKVADITGSGGDYQQTFNFSTAAAFVVAAAGHSVAKHGGRSVTSLCGSADLIEALGIKLDTSQTIAEEGLDKVGFCFLFAPHYHKILGKVAKVRKQLKFRTLFNFLGPLVNPARPQVMLAGVSNPGYMNDYVKVLSQKSFNCEGFVINSLDGVDEITTSSYTLMQKIEAKKDEASAPEYVFSPFKYGFKQCSVEDLKGKNPLKTADKLKAIFKGSLAGPITDNIVINAGVVLSVLQKQDLKKSFDQAKKIISSGKALEKLSEIIKFYQKNS